MTTTQPTNESKTMTSQTIEFMFASYDLEAYWSRCELLNDVWFDAFAHFDATLPTNEAKQKASESQAFAEAAWKKYFNKI